MREAGQKWVIAVEIVIALALIIAAFTLPEIAAESRLYGIFLYGGLPIATFIILRTPLNFQRTTAVIFLVLMIIASLYIAPPVGFEWLLPIYLLKLRVGFTAQEIRD